MTHVWAYFERGTADGWQVAIKNDSGGFIAATTYVVCEASE